MILLKDIQNEADGRGVDIQNVGINNVRMPFLIKKEGGGFLSVVADVRFTVSLPKEYKGTHMSRFIEILTEYGQKPLAEEEMAAILDEALLRLDASTAAIKFSFCYFVEKTAPVSGGKALLDVPCFFVGEKQLNAPLKFTLGVDVPYTSLCPCSKEISAFGAHNQRSVCRMRLSFAPEYECIYIEEAVRMVDRTASSPVYSLLKREDEKFVTETAYQNPKFVEDMLRDMVLALRPLPGLKYFFVECENFESIHNHNAIATHEEYL